MTGKRSKGDSQEKKSISLGTSILVCTALKAATILVAMASGKNICDQNSGESHQLATNRLNEKLT